MRMSGILAPLQTRSCLPVERLRGGGEWREVEGREKLIEKQCLSAILGQRILQAWQADEALPGNADGIGGLLVV